MKRVEAVMEITEWFGDLRQQIRDRVVRVDCKDAIYIGRGGELEGNLFGNPFGFGQGTFLYDVGSRELAVWYYRAWLLGRWIPRWDDPYREDLDKRRGWILDHLWQLHGKKLACFCAPKLCHGHVLAQLSDGGRG